MTNVVWKTVLNNRSNTVKAALSKPVLFQTTRSVGGTLPWLARPLGTASPSTCGLHHCPEIHLRKKTPNSFIWLRALLRSSLIGRYTNWHIHSFIHTNFYLHLITWHAFCECNEASVQAFKGCLWQVTLRRPEMGAPFQWTAIHERSFVLNVLHTSASAN